VLGKLALTKAERAVWQSMDAVPLRRAEWLLGRIAAKDAVRTLLREAGMTDICAADIAIASEESGRPVLAADWPAGWPPPPHISIAHKDGIAVGLAGSPAFYAGVGIDIETIEDRPASFVEAAFTPHEQALIAEAPADRRAVTATRIWCAKEAVGKAIDRGLADILDHLEARACADDGQVRVAASPALRAHVPGLQRADTIDVTTLRDGNDLIAFVAIAS